MDWASPLKDGSKSIPYCIHFQPYHRPQTMGHDEPAHISSQRLLQPNSNSKSLSLYKHSLSLLRCNNGHRQQLPHHTNQNPNHQIHLKAPPSPQQQPPRPKPNRLVLLSNSLRHRRVQVPIRGLQSATGGRCCIWREATDTGDRRSWWPIRWQELSPRSPAWISIQCPGG